MSKADLTQEERAVMDSLHLGYEAGRVPVLYYDMVWMARAYYDGDIPVTWILAHEPPTRIQ